MRAMRRLRSSWDEEDGMGFRSSFRTSKKGASDKRNLTAAIDGSGHDVKVWARTHTQLGTFGRVLQAMTW